MSATATIAPQRRIFAPAIVLAASLLVLALVLAGQPSAGRLGPVVLVLSVGIAAHRALLRWQSLLTLIVLVIMFIPIRRYALPSSLPFQLEPYRLVVAAVAGAWFTSMLIDPRVRLRRTGIDGPFALIATVTVASLLVNRGRFSDLSTYAVKQLMFLFSFILVVYMVASVSGRVDDVRRLLTIVVGSSSIVAVLGLVQYRTGYNAFDHLKRVFPFLELGPLPIDSSDVTGYHRGGALRIYASAQHPIALAAAMVMVLPFAVYLYRRTRHSRWLVAGALCMFAAFATVSRIAVVMLLALLVVSLKIQPRQTLRYWPALFPMVALIHVAAPGTLGTIKESFFPKGGLLAQEHKNNVGSGRLATFWPALRHEFEPHPFLGEGYGTRVVAFGEGLPPNAPILDDQWLGLLTQTGVIGTAAFVWLFVRTLRRLGRRMRATLDDDERRLCFALIASIFSFGVGMAFFDAFSFIQVTFLFFIFVGFAALLVAANSENEGRPSVRARGVARLRSV